jgi:hypothetical protein
MVVAIVLMFVPLPNIVLVLPASVIVMVFVTVLVRFALVIVIVVVEIAIVTVLGVSASTVPTLEMEFGPVTSRLVAVIVQVSVMYSVRQLGTPSPQLAGSTLTANNNASQHSLMESVMQIWIPRPIFIILKFLPRTARCLFGAIRLELRVH